MFLIFAGNCKCGSQLRCQILPRLNDENIIKIKCTASVGQEECGKRQCRGETRKNVVLDLEHESAEFYRSKKASEMIKEGDSTVPPLLYSANVLRTAKCQSKKRKYLDDDPMTAISKFKRSREGLNIIRDIGLDPIKVYFWSPHQTRLYNKLIKNADSSFCVDATGGLAKQIVHVDGKKSQNIFLYHGVLHTANIQCAVTSMLSECQDTVTITSWLMRWAQAGAEYPKEIVRIHFSQFIHH